MKNTWKTGFAIAPAALVLCFVFMAFARPFTPSLAGTWVFADAHAEGVKPMGKEIRAVVSSNSDQPSAPTQTVDMSTYLKNTMAASSFTFTATGFEFSRSSSKNEKGTWKLDNGVLELTYDRLQTTVSYPIVFKNENTLELTTDFDGHPGTLIYTKQF